MPSAAPEDSSPVAVPDRSTRRAAPSTAPPAPSENSLDKAMARHLKIASAQLGPLNKSDSRAAATKRLVELLRQSHSMGAKFVVFPELAFTTFFPRWWMEEQAEVDRRYFESTVPSPETAPLFDEANKLGLGF